MEKASKLDPIQAAEAIGKDLETEIDKKFADLEENAKVVVDDDELTQEQIDEILKNSVSFGADNANDPKPQEPEPQDPADIPIAGEPAKDEDIETPIETAEPAKPAEPAEPKEPKEKLELEKLKQEVGDARRKYIEKDYEADKKAGWLFNILKIGKRNLGNFSKEIDGVKAVYENALKNYKDAMVNDIVSKKGDSGDFENIIRYFQITESLNLRIGREDLKMEKHPNWEKWKGVAVGSINKYRELCSLPGKKISGWLEKYGYGGKWVGLGAGAVVTSSLLAQAGLRSASLPAAVFGGIVSTVGYKKMLETAAESSRNKKDEKEVKKSQKEMEEGNFAMAERVAKLNEILNKKIGALDERVQKEKAWKRWRTFGAMALGGATVFGGRKLGELASEKIKIGLEKIQDSEWNQNLSDKVFGMDEQMKSWKGVLTKPHDFSDVHKMSEDMAELKQSGIDAGGQVGELKKPATGAGVIGAETGRGISAEIAAKGDVFIVGDHGSNSLEGTIIKNLRAQGVGKDEAEKYAHNMAQEFLGKDKDLSRHLIHKGAKVEITADGKHIAGITGDPKMGWLKPHEHIGDNHIAADNAVEAPAVAETKIEASASETDPNKDAISQESIPDIPAKETEGMIDGVSGTISELENVRKIGFDIPKDYEAIKEINMLKFLEEMGKVERLNAGGGSIVYPNLPHTGFFNQSYVEQGKLARVFKNAIARGVLSAESISVSEALRRIRPEDIESLLKMKK